MPKEQRKLIYKAANRNGDKTLQAVLHAALRKYTKPERRLETLGADGSEVRFIAYGRQHQQALMGVFHKLTRGRAQEVIDMAKGRDEWPVHLVTAKGPGQETSEFVEGTLFFLVWKNHLILHQTNACRADSFQEHISWLLNRGDEDDSPGGVPQVTLIDLVDPIPPDVRRRSNVPVKRLIFGGAVGTKPVTPSNNKAVRRGDQKYFFKPTGGMWKALMEILHELRADIPDLFLNESLGENDLRVALELSCTKKNSESTAGTVLGALGQALSHSDAEYTVVLADDTTITGQSMKVTSMASVECIDRHPVHQSIFKCMLEYLAKLVNDTTIVEDEPFGSAK